MAATFLLNPHQLHQTVLDGLPPVAGAYSTRKLLSSATLALRVRRTSDAGEQDIGFTGLDLDTTSLLAFCAATDGYVATIYDQSGLGRNLAQADTARQCRIVASGVLDAAPSGKAKLFVPDATRRGYESATFAAYTGALATCVQAISMSAANDRSLAVTSDLNPDWNSTARCSFLQAVTDLYLVRRGSNLSQLTVTLGTFLSAATRFDGTNCSLKIGATTDTDALTAAFNVNRILLGVEQASPAAGNFKLHDEWAESIVWFAALTDGQRDAVMASQQAYFGIS